MLDTIHCCDYLDLMPRISDESVALVLSDPPFGIGYQNNYTHDIHEVMAGDKETFSYLPFAKEAYRVLRPDSAIFAYTGWSEYPRHFQELREAGFIMQEPLVVQKRPSGKTNLYGSFQSNADWIMFGHKGKFKFRSTELLLNKRAGTVPNKGRKPVGKFKKRFPACWFGDLFPWSSENPLFQTKHGIRHPTIKTVKICEWLIRLATDEGDTVLDPFCGTAPVAVASRHLNRRYICGDVCDLFCEYAAHRLRRNV
jgi:DNA modification methylase